MIAVEKITSFGARLRRELMLAAGRRLLGLALVLALGTLVLDRWLRLGEGTVNFLRLVILGVLARATWMGLGRLWRSRPGVIELAQLIDRGTGRSPGDPNALVGRYATLLQLDSGAGELERHAIERRREELERFDFEACIDHQALRHERRWLAGLGVVLLVFLAVFPGTSATWANRWLLGEHESWPQETHLEFVGLRDGALIVPRGEPGEVLIRVIDDSVVPEEVTLRWSSGDEGERVVMTAFGEREFRATLPPLFTDGELRASGGDGRVDSTPLLVRARPQVEQAVLTASLAAAEFEEQHTLTTSGEEFGFLRATELELSLEASEGVSGVDLAGAEGLNVAQDAATFRWTHGRAVAFTFRMVSQATGLASHPWSLSIALREDQPPRVTLAREGIRDRVTPMATIPLRAVATDDFQVASMTLHLEPVVYGAEPVEELARFPLLENGTQDSAEAFHTFGIESFDLEPGQVVQVVARAKDASHLGSQEGSSRPVLLRVVDPGQLMAEISARLQLARSRFRQAFEDARGIESALAVASPADMNELLRRHRLVDRVVWQTRRTLDEGLAELTWNALISPEADELLRQRAMDPLEELSDKWMRDQRSNFEAAIADGGGTNDALTRAQGIILKDMQQVLDGMAQWDSFVDLLNHLNEIIRLEEELRGATRDAK